MRTYLAALLLFAVSDTPTFELPKRLEQLLENGKWDSTPAAFRIIALSHLADGCAGQAKAHPEFTPDARACVEGALKRARALPKWNDGLYLSHLNLIYGAADQLGTCVDEGEHERVT